MRLLREEVYRLMAVTKGDLPSRPNQREKARAGYQALVDHLTREIQAQAPGDLSVTHESVEATLEEAYRDYRRRTNHPGSPLS